MSEREPRNELQEQALKSLFEADQKAMGESDVATVRQHTDHAKQLLEQHGWPPTKGMSNKAEKGLWLMVLHSDHDVEFQRQALEKLRIAVESEEAPKYQLAYLTDRVRRNTFQPQLFGIWPYTQNEEGEVIPVPIEDEEHIEERWREYDLTSELGAESFADHRRQVWEEYQQYLKGQDD